MFIEEDQVMIGTLFQINSWKRQSVFVASVVDVKIQTERDSSRPKMLLVIRYPESFKSV